jgi:hypothetical protein
MGRPAFEKKDKSGLFLRLKNQPEHKKDKDSDLTNLKVADNLDCIFQKPVHWFKARAGNFFMVMSNTVFTIL